MLKCVLLLMIATGLQAQSLKTFTVGALQCGLVKRGADSVQVYCYGPGLVIFYNSLAKVVPYSQNPDIKPGLIIAYGYGPDSFAIYLNLVTTGIYYELAGTGALATGVLVDIFASAGAGCGLPVNAPRFQWTAGGLSCFTAWADAWLDCCTGIA